LLCSLLPSPPRTCTRPGSLLTALLFFPHARTTVSVFGSDLTRPIRHPPVTQHSRPNQANSPPAAPRTPRSTPASCTRLLGRHHRVNSRSRPLDAVYQLAWTKAQSNCPCCSKR
jgi:hypothetical protein